MSKKGKLSIGAGILLFLALVTWVVYSIPDPPKPVEPDNSPRIMSYGENNISAEKDGKKQWELHADKISMNVDTQDAEMENIEGKFYEDDGRTVTLVSWRRTPCLMILPLRIRKTGTTMSPRIFPLTVM